MRIKRKITSVILMTPEEATAFLAMVKKAVEGQTVHAAETQLQNGSYLGVVVDLKANEPEMVKCWSCGSDRPRTGKDAWSCPKCHAPKENHEPVRAKQY